LGSAVGISDLPFQLYGDGLFYDALFHSPNLGYFLHSRQPLRGDSPLKKKSTDKEKEH